MLDPAGLSCEAEAWSRRLRAGARVGLWYPGDTLWHERILLYPVNRKKGDWYILTPDLDVYIENVVCRDSDGCSRAFLCGRAMERPAVAAGKFYRFEDWPGAGDLRSHITDARNLVVASDEEAIDPDKVVKPTGGETNFCEWLGVERRTGDDRTMNTKMVAVTPRKAVVMPIDIATPGGEPEDPGDDSDAEEYQWLTMEEIHGVALHTAVTMVKGKDLKLGDRGVHKISEGKVIAVYRARISHLEEDRPECGAAEPVEGKDSPDDARLLLPMKYDSRGKRWLPFEEGHKKLSEEILEDWPLTGERTVMWLFNFVRDHGGTFDSRHTKFVTEQKWDQQAMPSVVHDLLGFALELSMSYDQLDSSNIASLEVIARLYQVLEESGGSLQVEGLEHYFGRDRTGGLRKGIALAPGLARHAVDQQSKETAILKERRKAREEKDGAKGAAKGARKPP